MGELGEAAHAAKRELDALDNVVTHTQDEERRLSMILVSRDGLLGQGRQVET